MGGGPSKSLNQKTGQRRGQYEMDKKPIDKGVFIRLYRAESKLAGNQVVAIKTLNKKYLKPDDIEAVKTYVDKL